MPRTSARLGVISYAGAYYHPKTYHFRRTDGTQAAYVGSANLTMPGISSLHVEAGILLDTRNGDPAVLLDAIADGVDDWFGTPARSGLELVSDPADVARLAAAGVLSSAPPVRLPASGGPATGMAPGVTRPRLQPLIRFPAVPGVPVQMPLAPAPSPYAPNPILLPVVPRDPPYPPYILFAPGAGSPTSGIAALSGAQLPGGYGGLVIQLNRDSSRHWQAVGGTANISIPVPTLSTLRFGMFQGQRPRPRGEYTLEMRYLYPGATLRAQPTDTNVMVYGYGGDSGHGDVRMVVPAPQAREIGNLIQQHRRTLPSHGDVAFLEWPTIVDPSFRLSLLERGSPLFQQAATMLNTADAANTVVGRGACWLSPNISPPW